MRALIKEEFNTQLPQILPQAVSDFANPVVEKNVTESEEVVVLIRSSSQPMSTYEVTASLSEFELTKILIDNMEKNKSDQGTKRRKSKKMLSHPNIQEEPSHTVDDSGVQHDQEIETGNNDDQPTDKETWISQVARAKEPCNSFDELMDTSFDFFAFVLNQVNIKDLTQEILVGPAFELLKGTCKNLKELECPFEECSKATTERLD
ncbi:hypothetical protein Tco_0953440 [Tanacetum coccineum]|uniref:Uncharacterized protein n=1 Tax=Tanacetum coccineum TaxID=301880 RepID=A0ABQ5E015_9ASTR